MSDASTLRLGLFSPSPILFAAERQGMLAAAGITVQTERVRSSPAQFADLAAGRYDCVLTSPDNVLAYRYDPANLLGARIDVRILAGVDRGMGLSLVAAAGVATIGDLAGRRVAVDVPESGFALALFALLGRAGLERGRDYTVLEQGATPRRLEALLAGESDATLLNAGFDLRAEAAGARRLARIAPAFRPYLGTVLATTAERLSAVPDVLGRFLDAWAQARALVTSPAGRELVVTFAGDELHLAAEDAARFAATAGDADEGLVPDGAVERAALRTLAGLRRQDPPTSFDDTLARALDADDALIVAAGGRRVQSAPS